MVTYGVQFVQYGAVRVVAKDTSTSLAVSQTPTPAIFPLEPTPHLSYDKTTGVITFAQDCLFNSVFFTNLKTTAGSGIYWTDAEISTDDGITWTRGSDSARKWYIRAGDPASTREFPFCGGFRGGWKLRFVDWATVSTLQTVTETDNGSTVPARRLTYNLIPVIFDVED